MACFLGVFENDWILIPNPSGDRKMMEAPIFLDSAISFKLKKIVIFYH